MINTFALFMCVDSIENAKKKMFAIEMSELLRFISYWHMNAAKIDFIKLNEFSACK